MDNLARQLEPHRPEHGEICKYASLVYGEIEVQFLQENDVPGWPIKTAMVKFSSGREDSVRLDALTATGRKQESKHLELVFGGKGR